jgi:mannose-6-phosphate isomerase-like protein (cupin superfamily)
VSHVSGRRSERVMSQEFNMRRLAGMAAVMCVVAALGLSGWWMHAAGAADVAAAPPQIRTSVVALKDAPANRGDWGVMHPYFVGQTDATRNVFVATATVEPGKAVHHAHRHVEEEYLLITRGSGTWHLDGKEFPANKGDMLYVAPWTYHGIRNTGTELLEFVVFKYAGKGVPTPERPDDGRPDVLSP